MLQIVQASPNINVAALTGVGKRMRTDFRAEKCPHLEMSYQPTNGITARGKRNSETVSVLLRI
jgi:hypothetical protein